MNITEGIEMAKKLLQIMTSLDEDEASHMLTRVYRKCLDLKVEKKNLNLKQTVLESFLFHTWTLNEVDMFNKFIITHNFCSGGDCK